MNEQIVLTLPGGSCAPCPPSVSGATSPPSVSDATSTAVLGVDPIASSPHPLSSFLQSGRGMKGLLLITHFLILNKIQSIK